MRPPAGPPPLAQATAYGPWPLHPWRRLRPTARGLFIPRRSGPPPVPGRRSGPPLPSAPLRCHGCSLRSVKLRCLRIAPPPAPLPPPLVIPRPRASALRHRQGFRGHGPSPSATAKGGGPAGGRAQRDRGIYVLIC